MFPLPFEVLRLPGPSANASAGHVTPVARLHYVGLEYSAADSNTTCSTSQLELLLVEVGLLVAFRKVPPTLVGI